MSTKSNIAIDAAALQERDAFRADGWVKVLSPAKVNLHLAIGEKRADGYHSAVSVMHALNLHDVVYLKHAVSNSRSCQIVSTGDLVVPPISEKDNLAAKAIDRLANALSLPPDRSILDIRIEKSIPVQAGLGGGSSNAAAALLGASALWGIDPSNPAVEAAARELGADVAFFLHGGCAYLEGVGDEFSHALEPSKRTVVLVKPEGGVSTAEAYRRFDERPAYPTAEQAAVVRSAQAADEIALYNNLAPASEAIMPELSTVRTWLEGFSGVDGVLLCGSGAATFAVCDSFDAACAITGAARDRGWWARTTSFGSIRAAVVSGDEARGAQAIHRSNRGGSR